MIKVDEPQFIGSVLVTCLYLGEPDRTLEQLMEQCVGRRPDQGMGGQEADGKPSSGLAWRCSAMLEATRVIEHLLPLLGSGIWLDVRVSRR